MLCLLGLSGSAFAENGCPDGMTPFQNGNEPTPFFKQKKTRQGKLLNRFARP